MDTDGEVEWGSDCLKNGRFQDRRDTVFAAVVTMMNGIIGLALFVGAGATTWPRPPAWRTGDRWPRQDSFLGEELAAAAVAVPAGCTGMPP